MMNRRQLLALLSATGLASTARVARAEAYPSRPVTLLVGGAPGSPPDAMARPVAQRLAEALGKAVVVVNKPGAAGSLAIAALLESAPDGHTLALATMSQAVFNRYLFAKLPYDPVRDLEPVAPLVTGAMTLAAHPSFGARSLVDFVALAKRRPGQLFVAMPQAGSPPHIVALLLERATGIDVTLVPHKSAADATQAVISGEIPLLFDAPTAIAPLAQAGRLRALAVTGRQREPLLPDTLTARESGFDLLGEAWIGLVAPRRTPVDIVQRLNRELGAIMASPEMAGTMAMLSFRPMRSSAEEFDALIRQEHAKWGTIIRDAGLRLE
jgi:tripartite-type tricarboxylate transporter receptor subunit TctC